ncbi:gdp-mannose transporter gonst4 [Phtheirospermum japonicum]|uniref:Gdp-mannose transporter gonst4 n=1 Tax=Phtheirospermum japonicum TaxID=374723 RepID=A0A830DNN9_9LAMI|nr:gdp-mannose transporter gonst4 [Phtheirospermum japonicum]
MVTGVLNKFLTVVINVLIWDKHATPFGFVCLLLTIAGGVLYQQSITVSVGNNASNQSALLKQVDSKNGEEAGRGEEKEISGVRAFLFASAECLRILFFVMFYFLLAMCFNL